MSDTNQGIVEKVMRAYKSKFLKPLLGNGEVANKLEAGLYSILTKGALDLNEIPTTGVLSMSIREVFRYDPGTYTRAVNVLEHMGAKTIGDVVALTEKEIEKHRNAGEFTVSYIRRELQNQGLSLKNTPNKSILISKAFRKKPQLYIRITMLAHKFGIRTLGELAKLSENELLRERNIGDSTIKYIKTELKRYGLTMGDI